MSDIELLAEKGKRCLDYTVGSALDIFGGTGIAYEDLVKFNRQHSRK
jgi:phosphoribosylformimino-5-aminoimidazole carboxamide ribotide isomerase